MLNAPYFFREGHLSWQRNRGGAALWGVRGYSSVPKKSGGTLDEGEKKIGKWGGGGATLSHVSSNGD